MTVAAVILSMQIMTSSKKFDHIAFNSWYLNRPFFLGGEVFPEKWPVSSHFRHQYDIRDFRFFSMDLGQIVVEWEGFLLEDLELMGGTFNLDLWMRPVLSRRKLFAQSDNVLALCLQFAEDADELEWGGLYPCQVKSWDGTLKETTEDLLGAELVHLSGKYGHENLSVDMLVESGSLENGYDWGDSASPSSKPLKNDIDIYLFPDLYLARCNQIGFCEKLELPLGDGVKITYKGEWSNGAPCGQGEMLREIENEGWQKYIGEFGGDDGSLIPHFLRGKSETSNGQILEGEFGGYHLRQGRLTSNGVSYEGEFVGDGEMVGPVTITLESGSKYLGHVVDGQLEINSKIFPSGTRYEGDFKGSNSLHRHGRGCHYYSDETFFCGEWQEDEPVHGTLVCDGIEYSGEAEIISLDSPKAGPSFLWRMKTSDGDQLYFKRSDNGLEGPFNEVPN